MMRASDVGGLLCARAVSTRPNQNADPKQNSAAADRRVAFAAVFDPSMFTLPVSLIDAQIKPGYGYVDNVPAGHTAVIVV